MPGSVHDPPTGASEAEVSRTEMNSDGRGLLRWTVGSAVVWGGAFLAASVAGALIAGVNPLANLGPVGALTAIGFTVGGLVGPLARGLAARRRSK